MRRGAASVGVFLVFCLCIGGGVGSRAADDTRFGRYHALVIGNDSYASLPPLRTARNDARSMAQVLRERYGFRVRLIEDARRADILTALGEFRRSLDEQDNLLVYYAGHGYLDEAGDEGYWLPVDAARDNSVNWVSNASITTEIKAMRARHVLIVSDSCYAGKLARGLVIARQEPGYLDKLARQRARVLLTSGGLEPVPDAGGKGGHSVFAAALIGALRENLEPVEGMELFSRIRRPVMLNSDQTPGYSDIRKADHEGGDFIFVPSTSSPAVGSLAVETLPYGASVTVDGKDRGTSPLTLENIAPGQVKVRAEAKGYRAGEETVLVRAGGSTGVTLILEKSTGSVAVTSVPSGAAWFLDGNRAGTTPGAADAAPGAHRLTMKKDGFADWSGTVDVEAGRTSNVAAELRALARSAPQKSQAPEETRKSPPRLPEKKLDIVAPTF